MNAELATTSATPQTSMFIQVSFWVMEPCELERMRDLDRSYCRILFCKKQLKLIDQMAVPPSASCFIPHDLNCRFMRKRRAIRTIRDQRIVDIRNLQNARCQWNLFAPESVRISRTVELFVMMPNDGQHMTKRPQWMADSLARGWMLLHNRPLLFRERPFFQQHMFGNADLADVMHNACAPQCDTQLTRQTQPQPQSLGVRRQAIAMTFCVRVLGFDAQREAEHHRLRVL